MNSLLQKYISSLWPISTTAVQNNKTISSQYSLPDSTTQLYCIFLILFSLFKYAVNTHFIYYGNGESSNLVFSNGNLLAVHYINNFFFFLKQFQVTDTSTVFTSILSLCSSKLKQILPAYNNQWIEKGFKSVLKKNKVCLTDTRYSFCLYQFVKRPL